MAAAVDLRITGGIRDVNVAGNRAYRFGTPTQATGRVLMATGDGPRQIETEFRNNFSIAAGGTLDVNFTAGETDINGNPVNMTAVKFVYLELTSPGVDDYLDVGPQNVANGCLLWYPVVTANGVEQVRGKLLKTFDNGDGWPVSASSCVIRLSNPGAATITGFLYAAGVAS